MPWTLWHRPEIFTSQAASDTADEHRHRVGVVEPGGVGTIALDVVPYVNHDWQGAQGAEDARRAARIADIGVDAILHRDLDVGAEDLYTALQDG